MGNAETDTNYVQHSEFSAYLYAASGYDKK